MWYQPCNRLTYCHHNILNNGIYTRWYHSLLLSQQIISFVWGKRQSQYMSKLCFMFIAFDFSPFWWKQRHFFVIKTTCQMISHFFLVIAKDSWFFSISDWRHICCGIKGTLHCQTTLINLILNVGVSNRKREAIKSMVWNPMESFSESYNFTVFCEQPKVKINIQWLLLMLITCIPCHQVH